MIFHETGLLNASDQNKKVGIQQPINLLVTRKKDNALKGWVEILRALCRWDQIAWWVLRGQKVFLKIIPLCLDDKLSHQASH